MLWHEGKISAAHEMSFNLADRGLLLGDGLFETLPSFNGKAYRLEDHVKRMATDAECLGFPDRIAIVESAVRELAAADHAPASIRVTMTRGAGPRGLAVPTDAEPLIFATRAPWSPSIAFGETTLQTSSVRRNGTSPLATMKTLSYLDNVMAMAEARSKGADDALMLSLEGHVSSTSMANIFVVSGSTLSTPRRADAILPGVMRGVIIELAAAFGLEPVERALHPNDLFRADLVFVTNSLRLMARVTELDGVPLSPKADVVWKNLQSAIEADISVKCGSFSVRQKTG